MMGCASSKDKLCRNCKARCSPVRRSYSMHGHNPPWQSHHMVSLTSSTLGSLRLDPLIHSHVLKEKEEIEAPSNGSSVAEVKGCSENGESKIRDRSAKEEFAMGMIEVKTWSKMIDEKIPKIAPKTPIRTPPGEPEMINAWEMMEGLEDVSPVRPIHHFRSFSFQVPPSHSSLSSSEDQQTPRVKEHSDAAMADSDSNSNSNSNDTSIASEFDPEVIATFRKALDDLPPANTIHLKPLESEDHQPLVPRTDKLTVYFTSLRGVRKTFEDCCHVRVLLKGLGVKVDERDVSMHSGFKEELKELLGDGFIGRGLPIVFIGKKCVGGADEIRRLNEEGELERTVESCELMDDTGGGDGNCNACEACGDVRFMPCETCSGSCKIYYEGEGDYEEDDEYDECGFQRCPDCNENGLIRCPICCD
ncbi:uncharacterized protein At5g39865-like [Andrographis paniculata]|uniref:uncharacterized protein At5g39865-like n=1 Tax=Andrographis paniculata TaxID=175694 RepID=UPI0021E94A9C|nr:uncharacterized protein At5g39865-like [Andrographis paniculata]